ncbi:hypothetical protein P280DRAFT_39391 [Massarina eburnea CBS 473.64]|uniref:Uncharacterized protein n=1 Tax=Massarina eburnea CBS 473.64 TaxID=1395130 RepID=A0A6A6RYL1_9PLEO|nr:hypothetical protein P280DRAFT_39391 [Massarina eburnea CBS 473.64]
MVVTDSDVTVVLCIVFLVGVPMIYVALMYLPSFLEKRKRKNGPNHEQPSQDA